MDDLGNYIYDQIQDHKANPRDDLTSYLLNVEIEGQPVNDDIAGGMIILLLIAGIDTIEHCSLASDETIRLAAQRKTWFDMDIYNDDYILATGTENGTEQESLDKEKMIGRIQRETFRKAVRAGVPMLFGTDAGVYPHGDNARQFAKMVEWGMTPLQAIQAATSSAAQALGRDDVGRIAPGAWGDILAVKGDPTRDVTVLLTPAAVIKGGKRVTPTNPPASSRPALPVLGAKGTDAAQ